ncbi:hypothetical protein EDB92DRAFT_1848485 [Lactarius akahatsu]|uniref:LysM domain-containing protein n=1 Tax=Lactarius akahatsu TaxID=416441 RepID=A0AAD4LJM7_9AGAM|nr:hypothetical protein EDB92DRAFT_1848485 [Lactarius akahatsu]
MSRESNAMETLCLACSSSLPPRLWKQFQDGRSRSTSASNSSGSVASLGQSPELFFTRCCGRPICPSCLTANPRLARYNPCLLCLGGMGAVDPRKVGRSLTARGQQAVAFNVDGAVRDEDVFVVGDEDSEEHVLETSDKEAVQFPSTTAPLNTLPIELTRQPGHDIAGAPRGDSKELPDGNQVSPGRYYIRPDDTLLGISLRLGINGRALCKLNNLPPSTLNTTPYLLHTRTFLVLPESHLQHATSAPSAEEDARQTRVRAQIALQRVTKETDWGIAQAYVALAEDSDSEPDVMSLKLEGEKSQWGNGRAPRRTLEERAVDLYLDDDEWECREIAEGRVTV